MDSKDLDSIAHLVREAHKTSKNRGYWLSGFRNVDEALLLIINEVTEAKELMRSGNGFDKTWVEEGDHPKGIPIQLADIVIRVFDLAGGLDIDLAGAIEKKMEYNDKNKGIKR
jgi:NTP pyrophosphatase (non-canonical NTP hydrolase)